MKGINNMGAIKLKASTTAKSVQFLLFKD